MSRALVLTVVCAAAIVVPAASAAPALSHYRGVTLGDTVSVVADRLNVALSDVVVVHQRPTLVQQLTWRPHRLVSGTIVEPDPLAEMVLLFHLGRLVHVAVTYDRDRTEGLTNADLHDAFTRTYGTSMLLSTTLTPAPTIIASPAGPEVIGRWGDAETLVTLWRESYPSRLELTVASIAAEQVMQEAMADGVRLDASEAPARELARRATEEEALRMRNEKIRRDNKASFKP